MIGGWLRTFWPFGAGARESRVACRILFVCMGNLCRSPTAEAVFRQRLVAAGLSDRVACASAGTHGINVGGLPDGRARAAAAKRGYDMSRMRGRCVADEDFGRFDLLLAMDSQNLEALQLRCPPEHAGRLRLLMEFGHRHAGLDIPDPYFSNAKAFELVLDMIEDACDGLLEHVRGHYLATADPEPSQAPAPGD